MQRRGFRQVSQSNLEHLDAELIETLIQAGFGNQEIKLFVFRRELRRILKCLQCGFRLAIANQGLSQQVIDLGGGSRAAEVGQNLNGLPIICTEILDSAALREAEPNLRSGLAGGLLVPDDAVVYAPAIVPWLLRRAAESVELRLCAPITDVSPGSVRLADGERIDAGEVVCALGCGAARIFPGLGVRPRKGHLAITDRYPGFVRHQVVELGYMKSAHQASLESVAFNAQPRATGQVLLGSSRQFGDETSGVDWALLARMIRHAALFMPALDRLSVIRVWTGFRAATEDKLPLIGPYEAVDRVTPATGHEGLGITTALATAELVAAQIAGRAPAIPPEPYLPSRTGVRAHA
jgi:glycine/D-amino acid oxidase-like deaminating enzyme